MQRRQHLEPGQHAPDAVEAAASRLAVHMAAGQHRSRTRLHAFAPQPEIARVVHRSGGAGRFRPADQQAPGLAVAGAEAWTIDAGLLDLPDRAHAHEVIPMPVGIDGLRKPVRQVEYPCRFV